MLYIPLELKSNAYWLRVLDLRIYIGRRLTTTASSSTF